MVQMMVKLLKLPVYICKQNRILIISCEILRNIFENSSVFVLVDLSVDCYIHEYLLSIIKGGNPLPLGNVMCFFMSLRKLPKSQNTVRLSDFHAAHAKLRKRLFEIAFHIGDVDELRAVMAGIDKGKSLGVGID